VTSNRAGWRLVKGGKGSHRKFAHDRVRRKVILSGADGDDAKDYQKQQMLSNNPHTADQYRLIVYWSDEDQC
jgi:predicted RNA binding protein YcfA (HicA-like mRNA interferase family)